MSNINLGYNDWAWSFYHLGSTKPKGLLERKFAISNSSLIVANIGAPCLDNPVSKEDGRSRSQKTY